MDNLFQHQNKKRKYISISNDTLNNDAGSRVLVLPFGVAPCNEHIVELIDIVKPLIRQLVEDTNLVSHQHNRLLIQIFLYLLFLAENVDPFPHSTN